jgi:acylphosphatase
MRVGVTIIVSGLVQGVGFRYFVHQCAIRLNVQGYVRNLYNGDVDIYAEGERSVIEELISQIKVGPRAAQVNDVRIQWSDPTHKHSKFEIR